MATWLVAIGSVMASWALAAVLVAAELVRDWNQPGRAVASACFAMLRNVALGRDGVLVQIGLLASAATAMAVLAWRLGRSLLRARASTQPAPRDL